jgi:hypothetical protein
MKKDFWEMYKDSQRGQKWIQLFEITEDLLVDSALFGELAQNENTFGHDLGTFINGFNLCYDNLYLRELFPETEDICTREEWLQFVEDFNLCDFEDNADGDVHVLEDELIIKSTDYRNKLALIIPLSWALYMQYDFFKPMLYPSRFDILQRYCETLGIELPEIPRSNDYKAYLMYYYDVCAVWNKFQNKYSLTDAEFCACLYDFASMNDDDLEDTPLPEPTNIWFTGAGKGNNVDFQYLDSLGAEGDSVWACNERTKRGDLIVVYCLSPRSYIHSIWRAKSGGVFNPFDYYHCRTTIAEGVRTPKISIHDLKADEKLSQMPIVKKNLQGLNGVELNAADYIALLQLIEQKGGDATQYPTLFQCSDIDFGDIKIEKDVEENILIPMLQRLGYNDSDWSRQLSQQSGRDGAAIPDFVFFPHGEKHFANAPLVIEAKLDMRSVREQKKAYKQCQSYAKMMSAKLMAICDKERLIVYQRSKDNLFHEDSPCFEEHWMKIFTDLETAARLKQIIGKEMVKSIKNL